MTAPTQPSQKSWSVYSEAELRNPLNQKEVFRQMLLRLEEEGACRHVFHRLAIQLFGEDLA